MSFTIRNMRVEDVPGVVALQRDAFPPPFQEDLLWRAEHIERHLATFPEGQFVAIGADGIVGSCSNTQIDESLWAKHAPWDETVGGPFLTSFRADGSTLYGLDVSVHPQHRRQGIGRAFYEVRFEFVRSHGLARYGTACRLPDFVDSGIGNVENYVEQVVSGLSADRTLTPLLRYGLRYNGVILNYMDDEESGNAAAILEWRP